MNDHNEEYPHVLPSNLLCTSTPLARIQELYDFPQSSSARVERWLDDTSFLDPPLEDSQIEDEATETIEDSSNPNAQAVYRASRNQLSGSTLVTSAQYQAQRPVRPQRTITPAGERCSGCGHRIDPSSPDSPDREGCLYSTAQPIPAPPPQSSTTYAQRHNMLAGPAAEQGTIDVMMANAPPPAFSRRPNAASFLAGSYSQGGPSSSQPIGRDGDVSPTEPLPLPRSERVYWFHDYSGPYNAPAQEHQEPAGSESRTYGN